MRSSLIPERPLLISPTLAATIGLEEAVMLHVLSELMLRYPGSLTEQRRWFTLPTQVLDEALPFWNSEQIRRIFRNLKEQGLLLANGLPGEQDSLRLAINQRDSGNADTTQASAPQPGPASPATGTAQHRNAAPQGATSPFHPQHSSGQLQGMSSDWQPSALFYEQCQQQHGIPRDFIEQRVRSFVMFQMERGNKRYSWHNSFLKWIIKEWRQEQSYQGARELATDMSSRWQPSEDAFSILENADIPRHFIEDAVAEFILYWRERGLVTSTWNTKFIAHVRRQWAKYSASVTHDSTPSLIPDDFEPSAACFEVLAMANIDGEFARAQLPEFILYWQERKEVSSSWNTRFLQHVKYKWATRARQDLPAEQQLQSTLQRLTDRSWAD